MSRQSERTALISLGAGVQSSTLLLMAARSDFGEMPAAAVFADTQREPKGVYHHLDWLEEEVGDRIPIIRVTAGDLLADALSAKYNPIPLFKRNPGGTVSMGRRQCTYQYKLRVIRRWARENGHVPCDFWVGITVDELARMKPTGLQWATNSWPLIDLRMTRPGCEQWLRDYGVPHEVPKSACTFCPFHSTAVWRQMKREDPESWREAVAADRKFNERGEYVHPSAVPLDEVDLTTPEDHGQINFDAECEGICGV